MFSRKQKHLLLKFFSMFSVVRGYNILIIVIAQYLTSLFIFSPQKSIKAVLLDVNLLMLVLASAVVVAGGYIINNFYDSEKDLINRPNKTMLDKLVSQNTKLSFYFVLNFLGIVMASYVSFKPVLFLSFYIFSIWFYSHKLKRIVVLGNVVSALLSLAPFFIIFAYYSNFETVIFVHAAFLFLVIAIRELTKDLENIKGDLALDYKTLPIVYGEKTSKKIIAFLIFSTLFPVYFLITKFQVGHMSVYFYTCEVLLIVYLILLWKSHTKTQYLRLHNILKFIIVAGVFSILLINLNLVLARVI